MKQKFTLPLLIIFVIISLSAIFGLTYRFLLNPSQKVDTLTSMALESCPAKIRGDANCDGSINNFDVTIWKNEFSLKSKTKTADFNKDRYVNYRDYKILVENLPKTSKYTKQLTTEPESGCGWCGLSCIPEEQLTNCKHSKEYHNEGYSCQATFVNGNTVCRKRLLDESGHPLN